MWIEGLMKKLERKKAEITFDPHVFDRKENITYIVITRYHNDFIEVKTAWPKKGR